MGRFKPKKNLGFYAGTGGASEGVTSIAAGDGITASPDPITATGTLSETQISKFEGGTLTTSPYVGAAVFQYDPTTYPPTNLTITNAGRIRFGISSASGVTARNGVAGLATYDLVQVEGEFETTCTSGVLTYLLTANGALAGIGSPTFTGAGQVITCNGTTQTSGFSYSDYRIGSANVVPTTALADYFVLIASGGTGGACSLNSFDITITQHSD